MLPNLFSYCFSEHGGFQNRLDANWNIQIRVANISDLTMLSCSFREHFHFIQPRSLSEKQYAPLTLK